MHATPRAKKIENIFFCPKPISTSLDNLLGVSFGRIHAFFILFAVDHAKDNFVKHKIYKIKESLFINRLLTAIKEIQ